MRNAYYLLGCLISCSCYVDELPDSSLLSTSQRRHIDDKTRPRNRDKTAKHKQSVLLRSAQVCSPASCSNTRHKEQLEVIKSASFCSSKIVVWARYSGVIDKTLYMFDRRYTEVFEQAGSSRLRRCGNEADLTKARKNRQDVEPWWGEWGLSKSGSGTRCRVV